MKRIRNTDSKLSKGCHTELELVIRLLIDDTDQSQTFFEWKQKFSTVMYRLSLTDIIERLCDYRLSTCFFFTSIMIWAVAVWAKYFFLQSILYYIHMFSFIKTKLQLWVSYVTWNANTQNDNKVS